MDYFLSLFHVALNWMVSSMLRWYPFYLPVVLGLLFILFYGLDLFFYLAAYGFN